jgi:hypothetical protein
MNKHVVVVLGAGLAFGCNPKESPTYNPPMPPEVPDDVTVNPPPSLPTWDDVKTTHPEGATNPPHPILIVTPDGARCFKKFVGGLSEGPPDHVEACATDVCGTEITCPQPRASELLDASRPTMNPPATR